MAKSNKFSSKVPKLEDITLNWVDSEGQVDEEKAKKALHTLMTDKAKAQDAREDALVEVREVTEGRDDLQKQLDDKSDPDTQKELEKARAAQAQAESDAKEANLRADRLEIGLDKGLTPTQAKRLVGKDREELEADAEELVKDLGIEPKQQGEDEEGEEDGRTSPTSALRPNLTNGGDPRNGSEVVDYDKVAAEISGSSVF